MDSPGHSACGPRQRENAGAIIQGPYRYLLWRTWDASRPRLLWILLNPSTADARADDPTLRRCLRFSHAWRYGGLEIVNLFAWRAPDPRALLVAPDPTGPDNDRHLRDAAARTPAILLAWGARGHIQQRDQAVLTLLAATRTVSLWCLGTTRHGCPRHPLYVAASATPQPFTIRSLM